MPQKKELLDNRTLDKLLNRYKNTDIVTQIEEHISSISTFDLDLSKISLSSIINKSYYNLENYYNEEMDIRNNGIVEPLLVCQLDPKKEKYILLNGIKRFLLLRKLREKTVSVSCVTNITERQVDEFILLNLIKNNDNSVILAYGLKQFINKYDVSVKQMSQLTSISYPQIKNLIRILDLCPACLKALIEEKITYTKVRPLLSLNEKSQEMLLNEIIHSDISTRGVELEVKRILNPQDKKRTVKVEGLNVTISCKSIKDAKLVYKQATNYFEED